MNGARECWVTICPYARVGPLKENPILLFERVDEFLDIGGLVGVLGKAVVLLAGGLQKRLAMVD